MNSSRAALVTELAPLAKGLASPMPAAAVADGWSPETWRKWARIFSDLQRQMLACEALPVASITRALDHDGVVGGRILERAAAVSVAIRSLGPHGRI